MAALPQQQPGKAEKKFLIIPWTAKRENYFEEEKK